MAQEQRHTFRHLATDAVETDVRLAVIEYGDILAEYATAATAPNASASVVDDYATAVDVLALARRVPAEDVPPLLAVGARALRRVHLGLSR
ncbi:hypothetical protein I3F58_16510 [Streptomyces sp. MUM 203J]|uniref:hypothetical protein n=1 Tax=Streptomyces sp. MUM 203J TaxID=2791990 RepID=UPI001F04865A|nr:hypothetical protein [Streptomyces sp. MUM 203J]MCH0541142.1 hypothetical protein [Streptomyces sp. MUM 203J]